MASNSGHLTFDLGVSIADRVAALAPIINLMIEEHDSGESSLGVEAFQEDLMARLRVAGLMIQLWMGVDVVGVQPDNREKTMLVPIDVQDLLSRIVEDGWSWKKWDALAREIPKGPVGAEWRRQNEELAKGSDNMLAPYQGDMLKVLTGRVEGLVFFSRLSTPWPTQISAFISSLLSSISKSVNPVTH